MSLPTSMRALVGDSGGPLTALHVVTDRPVPKLPDAASGQSMVIVKVACAALNPVDWKIAELGVFCSSWPHAVGSDLAGTVAAASPGSPWKVGAKVWGYTGLGLAHGGTLAEYSMIPSDMLAAVPDSVSMETASTMGLAGLTAAVAVHSIFELPYRGQGSVSKPPCVLVYGASSSVGQYAVQLAKIAGARVVGVASRKNHAMLQQLGADALIDYHDNDWEGTVAKDPANTGMTFALDCIQGQTTAKSCINIVAATAPDGAGIVATVNPLASASEATEGTRVKLVPFLIGNPASEQLLETSYVADLPRHTAYLAELLEGGSIKPNNPRVFEGLENAVAALQELKSGKVSAEKLVVKI